MTRGLGGAMMIGRSVAVGGRVNMLLISCLDFFSPEREGGEVM